jgi:hypothetical protein
MDGQSCKELNTKAIRVPGDDEPEAHGSWNIKDVARRQLTYTV